MVLDHWSNDAMVSMDRCGLLEAIGRCIQEEEPRLHGMIVRIKM